MKKIICLTFLTLWIIFLKNQVFAVDILWTRTYDGTGNGREHANAITIGPDGYLYTVGFVDSKTEKHNIWVRKSDLNNNEIWVRTWNGSDNLDDEAYDVAVDSSGNVYVVGFTSTTSQDLDLCILKYDSEGNLQSGWPKFYNYLGEEKGYSICIDTSSQYLYVTGYTRNPPGSPYGIVLQYDINGNLLGVDTTFGYVGYSITIDTMNYLFVSGTFAGNIYLRKYSSTMSPLWTTQFDAGTWEVGYGVSVDTITGNVFVTGRGLGVAGNEDIWLGKFASSDGVLISSYTYNGSGNNWWDNGMAVFVSNNFVYLTGVEYSLIGGRSIWISKLDTDGVILWTTTYQDPLRSWNNEGTGIAVDDSGNVYVSGYVDKLNESIWVRKYDPLGTEILWTYTYNDEGPSHDFAFDVAMDADGNVYVAGTADTTNEDKNIWVRKYDPDGNIIWTSTYNYANNFDLGVGVSVDTHTNVYVSGLVIGDGIPNIFVRRYNTDGIIQWTTTYAIGYAIRNTVDTSGNVYVTGVIFQSTPDIFVHKYSVDGLLLFTTTYNGTAQGEDFGYDIAVDTTGNIYVVGYSFGAAGASSQNDIFIIKYSPTGDILWSDSYDQANKDDCAYSVAVDSVSNVYVAGAVEQADGTRDIFIRKYDSSGVVLWTKIIGNPGVNEESWGIAVNNNAVYFTGYEEVSGQEYNIVLYKYTHNGDFVWKETYNGPANGGDQGYGIAVDEQGYIVICGGSRETSNDVNILVRKYYDDIIPPAAITTLEASPGIGETIDLQWLASGDDGITGILTGIYKIQFSTDETESWNYDKAQITISTSNVEPLSQQFYTIQSGIIGGLTYYFRIWTQDDSGNWSEISNGATSWCPGDATPPDPVPDLSADRVGCTEGQIRLVWTATGDNGLIGDILNGGCSIQYTTDPTAGWDDPSNTRIYFSTSMAAGSQQTYLVAGLTGGVTYYFWLKLADEVPNWSDLSNKTTAWAQVDDISPAAITNLSALTGINEAEVNLSWSAPGDNNWSGTANYYEIRYSTALFYQYSVVPYYWVDGVTGGTIISDGDDISENVSLPFPFTFYGSTYTSLWICSNGFVSFTDNGTSFSNTAIPNSASPNNMICGLWDDLNPAAAGSGKIYYKSEANRFIITWNNVYKYNTTNPQRFQIILYDDNRIDINYASTTPDARDSCTVGIENINGTEGIQYRYDTTGEPIYDNLSLRFEKTVSWEDAFIWKSNRPVGGPANFNETETVTGLTINTTYYFAIKTCDEVPNWSDVSNIAYSLPKLTPPAAITDLEVISATEDSITLTWTAPGDDGTTGNIVGGEYWIKYSTSPDDTFQNMPYELYISTDTSYGNMEQCTIFGLLSDTTYYFYIRTRDEFSGNYSELSNKATGQTLMDTTPPAAITTLSAVSGTYAGEIDLSWLAPGDNGTEGTIIIGQYKIQYSTYVVSWSTAAAQVTIPISNVEPLSDQSYTLTGLLYDATYFIRIWTQDDSGNWSEISDGATGYSRPALSPTIFENWELGTIDINRWKITSGAPTVNTYAANEPSGIYSLELDGEGDEVTSEYIDLSGCTTGYIRFYWQRGGESGESPDWGEYLKLYIYLTTGWQEVFSIEGQGINDSVFTSTVVFLPTEAFHRNFQLRFRSSFTGWAGDDFYVDNIIISTMTYRIDGYVKDEAGTGIESVTINLTGDKVQSYLTDSSGYYEFTELLAGNYKVTASSTGWDFTPLSYSYTPLSSDETEQNFTGVQDLTPPATITDLSATPGRSFSVILSWTAPGDDGTEGNNIGGQYHLKYSTDPADGWNAQYSIVWSTDSITQEKETITISGLIGGMTYYFWLKTADSAGNWSEISNTATSYATPLWGIIVSTGVETYSTAFNNARRLVRDSSGSLYLAYTKRYPPPNGPDQVFVAKSVDNGQTWQDIGDAPIQQSWNSQYYPSLVVDSGDNLHCVWQESGQIFYSRYNGVNWSSKINISNIPGYWQDCPAIDVDSQDNLHVVWYGGDATYGWYYQIKYSSYTKATDVWSTPLNISPITAYHQLDPSIAVDSQDNVHVVWYGGDPGWGGYQIKYSRKTSTGWTPWVNIPQPVNYDQIDPVMVIDPEDNLHVVWSGGDATYGWNYQIKYSSCTAGTYQWSEWMNINPIPGYYQRYPSIAIDNNNVLHVFWQGYDPQNPTEYQVKYSSASIPAVTWSPWKNVTNSPAEYVSVRWQNFFTNSGNLDYCWTNSEFNYVMFNHDLSIELSAGAQETEVHYYSISGFVSDTEGNPLEGIPIVLTGAINSSTVTDSIGRYEFSALPWQQSYTVTPSSISRLFIPISRSTTALSGNITDWNFIGIPCGYITGKVTSTVDGSALPGTVIDVLKDGSIEYTTICDANGEYSIKVATGSYDVRASSTGYMPKMEQNITVVYAATTTVNFCLDPAVGYIAGKVTSTIDGSALSGALVEVLKDGDVKYTTICNLAGEYSIRVATGSYEVRASSTHYMFETKTAVVFYNTTTTVNFALIPAGYIVGKVTSTVDGSALSGAVVEVLKDDVVKYTTVCDLAGEYSIKVATGSYDVRASSTGYMPKMEQNITVVYAATTTVNFCLDPAVGYIAGKVTSTVDGSALVGAVIEVIKDGTVKYTTTVGADGNYSIKVATDTYSVKASSTGYMPKMEQNITVVYAATTTVNFCLDPAVGYIAGKVTSTVDDSALVGAVIEVIKDGTVKYTTTVGADGNYSIKVATDTYSVRASSTGYMPKMEQNIAIVYAATTTVNFCLDPAVGYIAGKVTSTVDGSALVGAVIEVIKDGTVKYTTTVGADGNYSIKVATDTYDVRASSTGYMPKMEQNITVVYAATTTVNFALAPAIGFVVGNVKKMNGIGVYQAKIELKQKDKDEVLKSLLTDKYGNYSFSVLEGEYSIYVTKQKYKPVEKSLQIIAGSTITLNFVLEEEFEEILEESEKEIIIPQKEGEIKVFGGSKSKGVINPEIGEKVKVGFRGKEQGRYTLRVFNLLGELVYQETKENVVEGIFEWLPKDIASGTYIVYVEGPGVKSFKKIAILR